MSAVMTDPKDARSTYKKVAEALWSKGFKLHLSVPIGSDNPQRFFWDKGAATIMVDCEGSRVERIKLTIGPMYVATRQRISSIFKEYDDTLLWAGEDFKAFLCWKE